MNLIESMATHSTTSDAIPQLCAYPQSGYFQFPPQPYIAPGLSLPEANNKFLGVFTASHLSICLLVSGFGLIVTGLLGVVSRASLDTNAFQAVGISLICFGSLLILIAIAIFVFAVRWGRKKIHVINRQSSGPSNIPLPILGMGYSLPFMTNSNVFQNSNTFDNLQTPFNNPLTSFGNQTFYTIPVNSNGLPTGLSSQMVLIRPSAPPQSPDSANP